MAFIHQTIMNVDIAAGAFDPAGNGVFAGFYADGIVTGLEGAVMNVHIGAGFHIDAVTILCKVRITDLHTVHGKVLAKIGMYVPCRRVHKRCAL